MEAAYCAPITYMPFYFIREQMAEAYLMFTKLQKGTRISQVAHSKNVPTVCKEGINNLKIKIIKFTKKLLT